MRTREDACAGIVAVSRNDCRLRPLRLLLRQPNWSPWNPGGWRIPLERLDWSILALGGRKCPT